VGAPGNFADSSWCHAATRNARPALATFLVWLIARGVFTSVSDLRRKFMHYIRGHAKNAQPIRWTYTNVKRRIAAKRITGAGH